MGREKKQTMGKKVTKSAASEKRRRKKTSQRRIRMKKKKQTLTDIHTHSIEQETFRRSVDAGFNLYVAGIE